MIHGGACATFQSSALFLVARHQEWLPGEGCRPPALSVSFLAGGWIPTIALKLGPKHERIEQRLP